MNADAFRQMDRYGRNYWWYRGKQEFVRRMASQEGVVAGGKVLDLGCGTGTLFEFLEGWGDVIGLELSSEALILARRKGETPLVQGSLDAIPFRSGSFRMIAIFDCLEHLKDDRKALIQVRDLIEPRGHVLISVPAFKYLTSWRDHQLMHMRRYSKSGLQSVLTEAGFEVRRLVFGYFCLYVPLLLKACKDRIFPRPNAFKSDINLLNEPWNSMVASWLSIEARLAIHGLLPIGTSLFALARPR